MIDINDFDASSPTSQYAHGPSAEAVRVVIAENAKLHAMLKGYKERARLLQTEVVAIGSKHASVAAKLEKETTAHALSRESSAQEMKVLKGQHDALVTDQAALKKSIQQLLNGVA